VHHVDGRFKNTSEHHRQLHSPLSARTYSVDNRQLSAWEQWVLRKAMEERDHREQELLEQSRLEQDAQKARVDKEKKRRDAEEKIRAWVEEYDSKLKQQKRLEKQLVKTKKELELEKKHKLETEASVKFQVQTSSSALHLFSMLARVGQLFLNTPVDYVSWN